MKMQAAKARDEDMVFQRGILQHAQHDNAELARTKKHWARYPLGLGRCVPDIPGWRQVHAERARKMMSTKGQGERWFEFRDLVQSSHIIPNFSRLGFQIVRTPPKIHAKLLTKLMAGLPHAKNEVMNPTLKTILGVDAGGATPKFILQEAFNQGIMADLKPVHEQWSKTSLLPSACYGFRIYQNGSTLNMHHDMARDRIISSIVHVGHDPDSEPWPIVIEGFDGRTYEVVLEAGEMLLYESAKCMHGRPRPFRGKWYSSLFIHYRPTWWRDPDREIQLAVPPGASHRPPAEGICIQ